MSLIHWALVSLILLLSPSSSHSQAAAPSTITIATAPTLLISGTPFSVSVTYSSIYSSVIAVDVLVANSNSKPASGSLVVTPGSDTRVSIPMIWLNQNTGNNFYYNVYLIKKNVYDANPTTSYLNALTMTSTTNNVVINAFGTTIKPPTTTKPSSTPTSKPTTTTTTITITTTTKPTTAKPITPVTSTPTISDDPVNEPSDEATLPPFIPTTSTGERYCPEKNNDITACQGCGYTVCRSGLPVYRTCAVGACNTITQQCDETITCASDGKIIRSSASTHSISWICLSILFFTASLCTMIL